MMVSVCAGGGRGGRGCWSCGWSQGCVRGPFMRMMCGDAGSAGGRYSGRCEGSIVNRVVATH